MEEFGSLEKQTEPGTLNPEVQRKMMVTLEGNSPNGINNVLGAMDDGQKTRENPGKFRTPKSESPDL
jgi:hypothetical protein